MVCLKRSSFISLEKEIVPEAESAPKQKAGKINPERKKGASPEIPYNLQVFDCEQPFYLL
jgi:hypothetical protein